VLEYRKGLIVAFAFFAALRFNRGIGSALMVGGDSSVPGEMILIYDGDCSFCKLWIDDWQARTGDVVAYVPFQAVEDDYPNIPHEQFESGVQLILPGGEVISSAQAVFYILKDTPGRRWLWFAYQHIPAFAPISEAVYRFIGRHRDAGYHLTKFLWGKPHPHSQALTRWLFLRLLGLIYLIAFLSLASQILGLVGSNGILPVDDFLAFVESVVPGEHLWRVPTLAWLNASDAFLQGMTYAGAALALLLLFDVASIVVLPLLWVLYLSLFYAGQEFLGFQWDLLLIEVGFLAIFFAPLHILPRCKNLREPSVIVLWLFRWLIFRLMFSSGVVKLASGDPTWANLTALDFHYYTQPLPTPLAWYVQQLPSWFHHLSVIVMFFVELVLPFLMLAPRRLRFVAFGGTVLLQTMILLTGNYTFFNWLTISLALLLLDDTVLRRLLPRRIFDRLTTRGHQSVRWPRRIPVVIVTVLIIYLSVPLMVNTVFGRGTMGVPLPDVADRVRPLRIVNGYGLFAVMTTSRPEIIIEGSDDGETWLPYEFKYKAGDVMRGLPVVAPFQPRLDWQMWFAALGTYQQNRWFQNLMLRLLEGEPQVLALFADNPFPDAPPQFIRASLYDYTFTTFGNRGASGAWWQRERRGLYFPEIALRS